MAKLSEWSPLPQWPTDPVVEARYEALSRIPPVVDRGEDNVPEMAYVVTLRTDGTIVVTYPGGKEAFFEGMSVSETQELDRQYAIDGRRESILPTGERTLTLSFARRRVF